MFSKPDSYAGLLSHTRKTFNDLAHLEDADITFRFIQKWRPGEVELDESAFDHIHDQAVLRVIIPSELSPAAPRGIKRSESAVEQDFPSKKLKTEEEVIDLTSDSESALARSVPALSRKVAVSRATEALEQTMGDQHSSVRNYEPLLIKAEGTKPVMDQMGKSAESSLVFAGGPNSSVGHGGYRLIKEEITVADVQPQPDEAGRSSEPPHADPLVHEDIEVLITSNSFSASPDSAGRMSAPPRVVVPGIQWAGDGVAPLQDSSSSALENNLARHSVKVITGAYF